MQHLCGVKYYKAMDNIALIMETVLTSSLAIQKLL
jgi:hypothetical protein